MRYFYDFEFAENGQRIDIISLGVVAEDGRELYLQHAGFDIARCGPFVRAHVLPQLTQCLSIDGSTGLITRPRHQAQGQCGRPRCPWRTRAQMADELLRFIALGDGGKIELWGYYAAYDHVALAQLFGPMADWPALLPMWTHDIKQLCAFLGDPQLPDQGIGEHNALADARWNKAAWEWLNAHPKLTAAKRGMWLDGRDDRPEIAAVSTGPLPHPPLAALPDDVVTTARELAEMQRVRELVERDLLTPSVLPVVDGATPPPVLTEYEDRRR